MLGIVTENLADASDTPVQALIEVDERAVAPDCALQFPSGDELSWPRGEHHQHSHRLRLKRNAFPAAHERLVRHVERERPESMEIQSSIHCHSMFATPTLRACTPFYELFSQPL